MNKKLNDVSFICQELLVEFFLKLTWREKMFDFVEAFRATLEEKGYKLDKWKRQ